MDDETPPAPAAPARRIVDLEGLKGLAHPLRVQIVDALSTYGPATASGLGERLGESSGATSYHLRQLERHGFVREVEGRGTARERWWEIVPGGFSIGSVDTRATPAGRSANRIVINEMLTQRERHLRDYIDGLDTLEGTEWAEIGGIAVMSLKLTAAQFAELTDALAAVIDDYRDRVRDQQVPGMRPIEIQMNAFPIMDGDITPEEES